MRKSSTSSCRRQRKETLVNRLQKIEAGFSERLLYVVCYKALASARMARPPSGNR